MPYNSDAVGKVDDRVRLKLDNDEVQIAESYDVHVGVLDQPAAFSLRLGSGSLAKTITQKYPPNTSFQLFIGDAPQFTGITEGFEADGDTGATEVTIVGYDSSLELHRGDIREVKSYENYTYFDLVTAQLKECGLGDRILFADNEANRKIRAGRGVVTVSEPQFNNDDVIADPDNPGTTKTVITTKVGEKRIVFLRRHLDRAGVMLWSDANGNFVLNRPNGDQKPSYRFVRQRGQKSNAVNITHARWSNKTTARFAECTVFSRHGGRKAGHAHFDGSYVDDEMFNFPSGSPVGFGYQLSDGTASRFRAFRDTNVTSIQQAEFYARRKAAESRRHGWQLTYTIAGHTAPFLQGNGRAVITPDTVAEVDDEEFGLAGEFYIESVRYQRNPATTTTITMMRKEDLIFGADE